MIKNEIVKSIKTVIDKKYGKIIEENDIVVERPKNMTHGDWMTNVALVIAKTVKKSPRDIASEICDELNSGQNDNIKNFSVAGPGFINATVSSSYLHSIVDEIVQKGDEYGSSTVNESRKINNEFISANPTGPLHLGNGRGGFLGDVITRVMKKTGAKIINEYYINDAGEQIIILGHSVLKDDKAVYVGKYIDLLHEELQNTEIDKGDAKTVGKWAANEILEKYIKRTTKDVMNIKFDSWISEEADIIQKGYVDKAVKLLEDKNLIFEEDGAKWLRTTEFGDDKDRVLVKSDGAKTYFASDCGYILQKMDRGFNEFIEIWGADHHGYIKRFEAAARALGFGGEITFLMVQLVRLMKDGKEVRMSKRAGNVVYIDELIDEVGHDVARFFFLMQSFDSHMDFDLSLAKEQSSKNPVYYVQYAHARLCSIIKKSETLSLTQDEIKNCDIDRLNSKEELDLIRELEIFKEVILEVADAYNVHRLPHYAHELAEKFHAFYTKCKVIDEDDIELSKSRLKLILSTKIVIAQTLDLMGVGVPEKM